MLILSSITHSSHPGDLFNPFLHVAYFIQICKIRGYPVIILEALLLPRCLALAKISSGVLRVLNIFAHEEHISYKAD